MKEVKEKKKPILFYYIVALAVIFIFNAIARPYYDSQSVKQVDYGTFMNMTEDEQIADVQIEENQILFKDKDGKEYRTGVVNDPQLTERLHKAKVSFNEVIKEKDSPFTDFLIAWILPILIFFGIGHYFNRRLMNRGGGNSLMFGAKNQVKVYVPSANGIHFDDVAGEDEAKENLSEIVDFLHHPDKSLDPALLRPGRFDRRVPVELPDLAGREAILKAHAKKVVLGDDVDFHTIARMAAGASGAELANIVNEAALRAVRDHRDAVSQADLEESIEVVIAGYQKKNAILSDDEKRTVAYHEIGHALVAALQTHSAPVQKITIIPRTSGALGYTMQVDQQDKYILSREELENKIATLTGGRAAEEVVFHQVTTGASNDIEQATKLARAMITRYGMTDEFDMVAMETVTNKYLGGDTALACAPETQKYIDAKVVSVVKEQHAKAKKILEDHRPALDALAKYLYEKETITGKEFMDILGKYKV